MTSQPMIEAYTDALSVEAGREIGLCVSTNVKRYSVTVTRVGEKRKVVWRREGFTGVDLPTPNGAFATGCGWPASVKIDTRLYWPSGYYSVVLTDDHGPAQGEAAFVVRAARPGREAKILLQRTTNTDNAYNTWGGSSLYNGPDEPAHRVSFDRPFAGFTEHGRSLFSLDGEFHATLDEHRVGLDLEDGFLANGTSLSPFHFVNIARAGEFWYVVDAGAVYGVERTATGVHVYDSFTKWANCWERWELPFVRWAETAGYGMDYAVNGDLEFRPEILDSYRLVLSVGHDEYWSRPMRDHLER